MANLEDLFKLMSQPILSEAKESESLSLDEKVDGYLTKAVEEKTEIVGQVIGEEVKEETKPLVKHTCSYCGYEEEIGKDVVKTMRKYDGSEQEFCSQVCYESFYHDLKVTKLQNGNVDFLTSRELALLQTKTTKKVKDMDSEQIEVFIRTINRSINILRTVEQTARVRRARVREIEDEEIVAGIRAPRPVKEKANWKSKLDKAVESYAALMGITVEEAKKELEAKKK